MLKPTGTRETEWRTTGPLVAVFVCRRCGRANCGEIRQSPNGALWVRNQKALVLPRSEDQRRRPGLDGEITALTHWHRAKPWCLKCGELSPPDNAAERLAHAKPHTVIRLPSAPTG